MTSIARIAQKMIAISDGNLHDINHFLKVWAYAKAIGELEGLDARTQFILEAAALTHDIACPLCRLKYGHAAGALQEKEGEPMVRSFLADMELDDETIDRIACLVGRHHTLDAIDGVDHQILIEADYLVNADESGESTECIRAFCEKHFRTKSGIALLKAVYPNGF